MKNAKIMMAALLALTLCVALAACMNGDTQPQATQQTNFVPEATQGAPQVGGTQQPVAFDWVTGSGTIEANVSRISEISDCRAVAAGTTALVGVKFSSAYQGEMTERIREMVAAEVMKADPSIQTVAVTAEEEDVNKVYEISDKLRAGAQADTLAEPINEIVRNATTLR